MHTVTKVLVVFAAILAVLLAALTMAYAFNAGSIVDDYRAEQNRRIGAETARTTDAAQARDQIADLNQRLDRLSAALGERESTIRRLEGERTDLIASVRKAEAERDAIVQKIDQLAATNQTQAKVIEAYSNEVTQLRENELRFRRDAIQLSDRIADLDGQREVLEQSVRALQEQLAEAREALQAAATGVATTSGESGPRTPTVAVRGRVTKVERNSSTGDVLAQINLGSNDQLRENMLLHVIRGKDYIADLVIVKTDLKVAVGKVRTYSRNVEVRADDEVVSQLR